MQSSHSSAGATSQPQSPRPSDSEPMPSLEVLISHLLAAKRSLSSINHVWQANEIVTAAGKKVLECAALKSRIAFARRTLQDQLELLRKTRAWSEEIVRAGREAFSDALNNLDAADDRLSQALDALRDTTVHSAFRPDDEDPKTLHDFVDEMGLEGLHTSLKSSIDRVTAIQAELDASNGVFDADIGSIHHKLRHWMSSIQQTSSSPELETSSDEDPEPELAVAKPVVAMFRSLESHAKDMAELLSSLVHHFDRCVKAVKHTEGGGEAARSITGDMPEVPAGEGMSNIGQEINANLNAPLQPMSNEEYREMVLVLIKDAFEAEDVVVEIQDRITEMEQIAQNMDLQHDMLKSLWKHAGQIKADMIGVNDRLPQYGLQSLKFIATWREEISNLNSGLAQLTDLHVMYEEFLNSYDNMILEAARRAQTRKKMEKVLRDAKHKLDHLYDEDVVARESFRVEYGDFLPSDLWPSISRAPMRVRFKRLSGGTLPDTQQQGDAQPIGAVAEDTLGADEGAEPETIPDLPHDLIRDAYERIVARG